MVLGVSLSGTTISAGCGTLLIMELEGDESVLSGLIVSDPVGSEIDFTICDNCDNVNDNDYNSAGCDLPDMHLYLNNDGSVAYHSSESIAGFQFNVDGGVILDAYGGAASEAEFMMHLKMLYWIYLKVIHLQLMIL
jgi:hypothetical protein